MQSIEAARSGSRWNTTIFLHERRGAWLVSDGAHRLSSVSAIVFAALFRHMHLAATPLGLLATLVIVEAPGASPVLLVLERPGGLNASLALPIKTLPTSNACHGLSEVAVAAVVSVLTDDAGRPALRSRHLEPAACMLALVVANALGLGPPAPFLELGPHGLPTAAQPLPCRLVDRSAGLGMSGAFDGILSTAAAAIPGAPATCRNGWQSLRNASLTTTVWSRARLDGQQDAFRQRAEEALGTRAATSASEALGIIEQQLQGLRLGAVVGVLEDQDARPIPLRRQIATAGCEAAEQRVLWEELSESLAAEAPEKRFS
jgi:hypothetical protein